MLLPAVLVLGQCLTPQLADRRGTESCHVAFSQSNYSICFDQRYWDAWLKAPEPLCGPFEGKWKTQIFRRNDGEKVEPALSFVVKQKSKHSKKTGLIWPLVAKVEKLRQMTSLRLAPYDPLGVARRLVLNEKTPSSDLQMLRLLGFIHLLTATGIHLYALADLNTLVFRSLSHLLLLPPRIALSLSRISSFSLFLYSWLLAGMRPGMLRPWLVVAMRSVAKILGFRWYRFSPLFFALLFDLVVALIYGGFSKTGAWAPGRWVYASAVGGGLLVSDFGRNPFEKHLLLAIGSWVFSAWLEAFHTGIVSPITPVISLLTIPVFVWLIYPSFLASSLAGALGIDFWALSKHSCVAMTSFIDYSVALVQKSPYIWIVSPRFLLSGMILGLVTELFFSKSIRWKIWLPPIALGISLIGAFCFHEKPPSTPLEAIKLEQLDVGQGDSALVHLPGQAGLIDTGSKYGLSSSAWFEVFAKRGIRKLEWVALTHLDDDHSGGLALISAVIPIDCVVADSALIKSKKGVELSHMLARTGTVLRSLDDACFPFPHQTIRGKKSSNSNMTAFSIPLKGGGIYLNIGDASQTQEQKILPWIKKISTDAFPRILKIGHHGSKTSTSPRLLEGFSPTRAWISAGFNNSYGHPADITVSHLNYYKISIERTDREGVLVWKHPP